MSDARIFKAGELVMLKSGGPLLTVSDQTRADGLICVEWFDDKKFCRDSIHPDLLLNVIIVR